jgi:hypothetical protein
MIALAFFAGIFLTATVAIMIVRGASAPQIPIAKGQMLDERAGFRIASAEEIKRRMSDDRMRTLSVPTPDATFWDIARDDESKQPEPGRVEYRFLGITGLEDE